MQPLRPASRLPNAAVRAEARERRREELLDQTIALFEPRAGRRLSREDAREIVENLTGFFRLLQEWDRAERRAAEQPKSAAE